MLKKHLNKRFIKQEVYTKYINSIDFNGIGAVFFLETLKISDDELRGCLKALINDDQITLCFSSVSVNPHIKRIPDLAKSDQLNLIGTEDLRGVCIYPSIAVLNERVDEGSLRDRPYSRELMLGAPQLAPRFFEMTVLERYKQDPRYYFKFRHFSGTISISDEFFEKEGTPEKDQVIMQTYGLGISEKRKKVIVVYLRYLQGLTPEHQQHWKSFETTEKCFIVPEYYKPTILAEYPDKISIYDAIIKEIQIINSMCAVLLWPPFFRADFKEDPPENFSVFFQPTLKNFNEFVSLLDKMLSQNINQDFFKTEFFREVIQEFEVITQPDGIVERRRLGTIQMLQQWLEHSVGSPEISEILNPLKEVRRLRQSPAHKVEENKYDPDYDEAQDKLVHSVYVALRYLRILFSNDPLLADFKIPAWLEEGRIVSY